MIVVSIMGMHRSGTSALAGSLQQHGVYLGNVFEKNPYNQKGNRENAEIMNLNDQILAFNNGKWDNPPESITWIDEQRLIRDQIIRGFLESNYPIWGFKDPRTLFTLQFWLEGLSNLTTKFIASFRHPEATVHSLISRDNMSPDKGFDLWNKYNSRLLQLHNKYQFPIISYDVNPNEYKHILKQMLTILNILPQEDQKGDFFDHSLRHQSAKKSLKIPKISMQIYNELLERYLEQIQ